MSNRIELPIIAVTIFLTGTAMFVPALVALASDDHQGSRAFFYTGLLIIVFSVISGIASHNFRPNISRIDQLFGLLLTFALLPALLAVPIAALNEGTPFLDLYVDMVSCLTTTGTAIAELQSREGMSIEVWRAEAAWLGGYLMWVAAAAILEPLSLGGFEVRDTGPASHSEDSAKEGRRIRLKLKRLSLHLLPWYFGATALLWILEMTAGEGLLPALVLAMSTVSTSGITLNSDTGLVSEAIVLVFLVLAWSSIFVTGRRSAFSPRRLIRDSELRMAVIAILASVALFVIVNLDAILATRNVEAAIESAAALWAAIYTSASFLATAGFKSSLMDANRVSGDFHYPEFLLIVLAVCGGGVATTAGGIKLLRIVALAKLGDKELSRLVYPSTVSVSSGTVRGLRVTGQEFAWIAFTIFFISLALYLLAFAATGMAFREAAVVAVAALSTTGPIAPAILGSNYGFAEFGAGAKCLLASAMILGRLEFLTVIALFNPALWRR